MASNVVPLYRSEQIRVSLLKMAAAGHRLQAGLAIWFDFLHKRFPEDRDVCIFSVPEIVNQRSVVVALDPAGMSMVAFTGQELNRTHEAIAIETVRDVSLATPIAFTHEWDQGNSVSTLVLPFRRPDRTVVAVLFDW